MLSTNHSLYTSNNKNNSNQSSQQLSNNITTTNSSHESSSFRSNLNLPQSRRNMNNKQLSKPSTTMTRSSDTQYNLSLIRPSDRVVLYSPVAHCYGMYHYK